MAPVLRLAGLALAAGLVGCTLLLDTPEPRQCTTTADCESRPALRNRVCAEGFCVNPQTAFTPVAADGGSGCVSTALCTQANSNRPSRCPRTGEPCVPWETPDCPVVAGAWDNPNALVVGVLTPLSVLQHNKSLLKVPYIQRYIRGVNLAMLELNESLGLGLSVGLDRRPLAVVHCDSWDDPAHADAMFDHLVDTVGAQAVIVTTAEDVARVAEGGAQEDHPRVVGLAGEGARRPARVANAAAHRAGGKARRLARRPTGDQDPRRPRPRAVGRHQGGELGRRHRYGKAFAESFAASVTFNGKGALANGASFVVVQAENPRDVTVDHIGYAQKIAAEHPHVIVVAMGQDFPTYYVRTIEDEWPVGAPRPYYVLSNLSHEVTPYAPVIGLDDELRKRFSGTRPAISRELQANVDAYVLRYRQEYNNQAPDSNHSGYEAFYALAYAMAAASQQSMMDGPHISTGFESLVAGSLIDVGPGQASTALGLLSAKGSIDLAGCGRRSIGTS
ncbi:MAG: hypothetical protein U0235_15820 [Polyangiaceae bacterium]